MNTYLKLRLSYICGSSEGIIIIISILDLSLCRKYALLAFIYKLFDVATIVVYIATYIQDLHTTTL